MTKRSIFTFLFLSFLTVILVGKTSLNLSKENIECLPSLSDDVFKEQQAEHSSHTSLLSFSDNCLRISHFSNTQRPYHRNINRTLTGGNGINSYSICLATNANSKYGNLNLRKSKNSNKTYFLYKLRRLNI